MNSDFAVIYGDVINTLADSIVGAVDAELGHEVFAFEVLAMRWAVRYPRQ